MSNDDVKHDTMTPTELTRWQFRTLAYATGDTVPFTVYADIDPDEQIVGTQLNRDWLYVTVAKKVDA